MEISIAMEYGYVMVQLKIRDIRFCSVLLHLVRMFGGQPLGGYSVKLTVNQYL